MEVFSLGSRVRVINYSPWRGLKGTILSIHMIATPGDEPFCFYLVTVEGAHVKEPIWFEYTEVEHLTSPDVVLLAGEQAKGENQKGST